jgi:hypothetical protein
LAGVSVSVVAWSSLVAKVLGASVGSDAPGARQRPARHCQLVGQSASSAQVSAAPPGTPPSNRQAVHASDARPIRERTRIP